MKATERYTLTVHGAGRLTGLTAAEVDAMVKRLASPECKRLQPRESYLDSGWSFRVSKERPT